MHPEDIAVALALTRPGEAWAVALRRLQTLISPSDLDRSLRRLADARLCHSRLQLIVLPALTQVLLHGVPFLFPARLGEVTRGVPTAWCEAHAQAEMHLLVGAPEQRVVWPLASGGEGEGRALEPLAPWVPLLAQQDADFARRMALAEILRVGRARERAWATAQLRGWEQAA